MGAIKIRVLGGFEVSLGRRGVLSGSWRHKRAADLVKMLAISQGHRLHRERILDALWPDLPLGAGGANLRKAVHYARKVLGEQAIATDGDTVTLIDAATDLDSLYANAAAAGDPDTFAKAATQYAGPLLPDDPYAPWIEEERRRVEAVALKVMRGARLWERLLEIDPLDEEAHQALMRAALDAGDRRGAIRQFERLRERLRIDLGLGPSQDSVGLYEKALAMEGRDPPSAAEQARMHLAWGLVHLHGRDVARAQASAEEARALAVGAGLGREVGEASALLGMIAHARGAWRESFMREFEESLQLPTLAPFIFDAHLCLAEFSLYGDEGYVQTISLANDLLARAKGSGSAHGEALAMLMLGEAELMCGDLRAAVERLRRAVQLHSRAASRSGNLLATVRLAEAEIALGRKWQARRLLMRPARIAAEVELAPHLVVRVYGALIDASDDPPSAVAVAGRVLSGADVCDPCSMGFHIAAAVATARARNLEAARRHLADAERIAGLWQGGPWLAAVWEARGALRLAEGRPEQAAALFTEASGLFYATGRIRDAERCKTAAASL